MWFGGSFAFPAQPASNTKRHKRVLNKQLLDCPIKETHGSRGVNQGQDI